MAAFSKKFHDRKNANASGLLAFDVEPASDSRYVTESEGSGPTVFTVGYERRDGEELVSVLVDAGVSMLVDVRERAMSRKPDFRSRALQAICQEANIDYVHMPRLGSNDKLRDELRETGDFKLFARKFKAMAKRWRNDELEVLSQRASTDNIALLCYERAHCECHRSVLAELLHEMSEATIVAIK